MQKRAARDDYLRDLSSRLIGSRRSRRRLLAELCDHIEESIAAKVEVGIARADAERQALAQLGDVSTVVCHWHERTVRARRRRDARVALAVALAAVASILGVTSAANGRRDPPSLRCAHTAADAHDCTHHGARAQPSTQLGRSADR